MKTDIMFTDPNDKQIKVLISKDGIGQNYEPKLFSDFVLSNDENPDCIDPYFNDTISLIVFKLQTRNQKGNSISLKKKERRSFR